MYERFTDAARKVMQLANQESQRFNHEYIGTEHMLLGLIKPDNNGSRILIGLGVTGRQVYDETSKLVHPGTHVVTLGKLPQTPRAKKAIELAMAEARETGINYVGTEHMLIGLVREEEGVAAQILLNLGVTAEKARAGLLQLREEKLLVPDDRLDHVGVAPAPTCPPKEPSKPRHPPIGDLTANRPQATVWQKTLSTLGLTKPEDVDQAVVITAATNYFDSQKKLGLIAGFDVVAVKSVDGKTALDIEVTPVKYKVQFSL